MELQYWREAHPGHELKRIRVLACGAEEELFDAVMELEDAERKIEEVCAAVVQGGDGGVDDMRNEEDDDGVEIIRRRGRRIPCGSCARKVDEATRFQECLEILVKRKNETLELNTDRRTNGSIHQNGNTRAEDMDIGYLVKLNAQLKRAQERVTSAQLRWDNLMEHSRLFSSLLDDETEDSVSIGNPIVSSSSSYCIRVRHCVQFFWIRHLRYYTYRFAAVFTATLSVFVIISEVTLAAPANLSPFSWTLHALDDNGSTVLFQMLALIPLLYMSICVYTCLFQMSLLGPYCLRGNRQSHGVALVFNAQYLVRLQFSLGYNYLLM
jgi:transcriptional regulator NrdR family protein